MQPLIIFARIALGRRQQSFELCDIAALSVALFKISQPRCARIFAKGAVSPRDA
jgi:hypothetical protein